MLGDRERVRYTRQMMMFGEEGQERLKRATVLIAGAGGLGCPIALYLAVAGVGHIRLIDRDTVDESNLNRQILHWTPDIGKLKCSSAFEKLTQVNPEITVTAMDTTVDESNAGMLVSDADVIVDAMDNYPTRYLLNRISFQYGVPFVHGAIRGFYGQVTVIVPGRTPCLACIFPRPPPTEVFPVIGVTPGIIGLIQANETIKHLLGTGTTLENRLLLWDGFNASVEMVPVTGNPECEICGQSVKDERGVL